MNDATVSFPADDFGRLLVIAGEVGRARAVLGWYDEGRDCLATVDDLRLIVDRISVAVTRR